MQAYSDPKRANDPHALPDIEVFYIDKKEARHQARIAAAFGEDATGLTEAGWYWQACFPGCLPDGEPNGPFATEAEALADAREYEGDDEVEGGAS